MSFVDVFGGSPVQPSDVAYREINLTADITLTWPSSLIDTDEILARIMNVTPDMAGHTITLPSATQVSVGADFLIYNVGASSFNLNDATGGNLIVINPGEAWYFWLTDNTTEAGTWSEIQFGTGTAAIVANALAGNGLTTINGRLNTNYPYREISANYAVQLIDRAALIVWTGGTGTITLPSIADATRGFYVAINNQGTGLLSVVTADGALIDGEATFNLNIGNSSLFICTNPNWNSLGYGRNEVLPITALPPLNISGAGGLTILTASQYQNTVLEFTGALTMNEVVEFPSIVSYWLITNSTTNAFTVTARLSNLNSVILPQGLSVLVYCDGNELHIISGASTGNTVSSILGTVNQIIASPSTGTVTLSLDTDVEITNSVQIADLLINDTGLLTLSPNQSFGLTTSGTGTVNLRNSTAGTAGVLRFYANNFTNSAGFTAGARTIDTTWRLPLTDSTGTQALVSDGAGNLSWSTGGGGVATVNGTAGEIVANTVGDTVTLSIDDPLNINNIIVATNTRCGDLLLNAEDITSINPNGSVNIYSVGTGRVKIENLSYPATDGTAGQVISTDGAGNLSFVSAPGGTGNWILISSQTAANSAAIDFTGLDNTYQTYVVMMSNVVPVTNAVSLYLRTSSNNGVSYDSGGSDYVYRLSGSVDNSVGANGQTTASQVKLTGLSTYTLGNGVGQSAYGPVYFYNIGVALRCNIKGDLSCVNSFPYLERDWCDAYRNSSTPVNAIRFLMSSGNILSGTFTLYGLGA
jgi:hypothetical protein